MLAVRLCGTDDVDMHCSDLTEILSITLSGIGVRPGKLAAKDSDSFSGLQMHGLMGIFFYIKL